MTIDWDNCPSNTSFLERETDPENAELTENEKAVDQLRKVLEQAYTKDKLSKQVQFNAICLRKLKDPSDDTGIVRVKARIPELHSLIPKPKSEKDYATMSLYPTFVALKTSFKDGVGSSAEEIPPGTVLLVTFGNMSNFSQPRLLEIGLIAGSSARKLPSSSSTTSSAAELGDSRGSKVVFKVDSPIPGFKVEKNPGVFSSTDKRDINKIDVIVLHDALTISRSGMKAAFLRNPDVAYGTHFSVGKGGMYQYVDVERTTSHTFVSGYNKRALGLDMVGNRAYWSNSSDDSRKATTLRDKIIKAAGKDDPPTYYAYLEDLPASSARESAFNDLISLASYMGIVDSSGKLIKSSGKSKTDIEKFRGWDDLTKATFNAMIKTNTSNKKGRLVLPNKSYFSQVYKAVNAIYNKYPEILKNSTTDGSANTSKVNFPSYNASTGKFQIGHLSKVDGLKGIVAHGSIQKDRADGRYSELYLFLRMVKGLSHHKAYVGVQTAHVSAGLGKYTSDIYGESIYKPWDQLKGLPRVAPFEIEVAKLL
jgi:hypothetical protein